MRKDISELIKRIEAMDSDNDTWGLYEAMQFYCSETDKREAYKKAIIECLRDDYEHHEETQDPQHIVTLKKYLNHEK